MIVFIMYEIKKNTCEYWQKQTKENVQFNIITQNVNNTNVMLI